MTDIRTIVALAAVLTSLGTQAWALDAETADLVSSYTVELPKSFSIDDTDGTVYVGVSDCEDMLADSRVSVAFETLFNAQTDSTLVEELDMFGVERDSTARIDCLTGELCTRIDAEDYDFSTTGVTVDVAFADLLAAADLTDCAGYDKELFIRLVVDKSTTDSSNTENADARIIVDTIAPTPPSGLVASATENTIRVEFEPSADSDINRYFVYWSTTAFESGQDPADLTLDREPIGDNTTDKVSVTLNPADDLYVAVVAEDLAGNLSVLSGVVQATVVETNDFWEQYRNSGGSERGGCSTTSVHTSPWLFLCAIGLFGLGRRRRRHVVAASLLGIALLATPLSASAETKTWGAFELKMGGYYPAIDAEFGGSGPFESVFGGKSLLLGELEVDGWLWQRFGKLGIAGNIGYSRVKGGAVSADTSTATDATTINDTTTFMVIPLRMSAVYRFDWLAQNTRVPLSASVKVGPDFYRWRIANSNHETATFDGDPGAGWKKGWHFAAGLQLLLDFIDPAAAAAFDLNWGVNNSYLFVEYLTTKVDDFGGTGFDLSDDIWMFGLSFEF